MLYVVTGSRTSIGAIGASIIKRLEEATPAEVIQLQSERPPKRIFVSKREMVRLTFTPRLRTLRGRWSEDDVVLVIGWYLVPILILLKLRLLPWPRRLVSLAAFTHDRRVRSAVNYVLRASKHDALEFVVLSGAEQVNLVDTVGLSPERVHRLVYRGTSSADETQCESGSYVFTGGHTNRDYGTFFKAVESLTCDVVAVVSPLNDISDAPSNVDLRIGTPRADFERFVSSCAVLVLPLQEGGEACGQTVLASGIRYKRPVVATRHDSLLDYLGSDYPGFVPPHDVTALRTAIDRTLSDPQFRDLLVRRIAKSKDMLEEMGDIEDDFVRILARGAEWR